ncbi:MAG: hypothetical protein ACRDP8_00050 [Actinopolymorphaceae bacterium]
MTINKTFGGAPAEPAEPVLVRILGAGLGEYKDCAAAAVAAVAAAMPAPARSLLRLTCR